MEKKPVVPPVDLHELRRIIRETGGDQIRQRKKIDSEGAQLFPPVASVVTEDEFDIVLVNREPVFADATAAITCFVVLANPLLVSKRYLGIRNHGGQKECMGSPALGTSDTTDAEADNSIFLLHRAFVVTVNREASRMPAGTD